MPFWSMRQLAGQAPPVATFVCVKSKELNDLRADADVAAQIPAAEIFRRSNECWPLHHRGKIGGECRYAGEHGRSGDY